MTVGTYKPQRNGRKIVQSLTISILLLATTFLLRNNNHIQSSHNLRSNHSGENDVITNEFLLMGESSKAEISGTSRRLSEDEELAISVSFEDIYTTIIFCSVAWLLGQVSTALGLPSLVGEICTGFLLGPPLANIVAFPGAFVLLGNFGLIGLILESGVNLDVAQLKDVGKRAFFMAFCGSALPILAGFGIGKWKGLETKAAIALGAVFSPSSLGVTANTLSQGGVLNTPIGQMIVASSVVDDVLGLVMLSILGVFLDPNPTAFDFILPFISSFGFLIVLGLAGITVIPRVIETRILPRFEKNRQELIAFVLMFALLVVYMPALNYARASFLTGVFLAGLSFSQIHSVQVSFVQWSRPVLNWLLRIFFAATIGFQVPVTKFHENYVLKWGFVLFIPVLCKLPLGLFVPRFQRKLADDFPYDPYVRDVLVTSLAMTARGEFNFIVASFSLANGLFDSDVYSSVVFAVLFACILAPLILMKVINYYNEKSRLFIEGNHPVQRIGNTSDGLRPCFFAIQARTPVHWGLQEKFERVLAENGLIMIDHRSWHTLGHDQYAKEALDITEMFVQDTVVKVRIPACFGDNPETIMSERGLIMGESGLNTQEEKRNIEHDQDDEDEKIQSRSDEIRDLLVQVVKGSDADSDKFIKIQVAQWKPCQFTGNTASHSFYTFKARAANSDVETETQGKDPDREDHSISTASEISPALSCADLWETDKECHDAARCGYILSPDKGGYGAHDIIEGFGSVENEAQVSESNSSQENNRQSRHRRRVTFDASLLLNDSNFVRETSVIRGRLHGYVR